MMMTTTTMMMMMMSGAITQTHTHTHTTHTNLQGWYWPKSYSYTQEPFPKQQQQKERSYIMRWGFSTCAGLDVAGTKLKHPMQKQNARSLGSYDQNYQCPRWTALLTATQQVHHDVSLFWRMTSRNSKMIVC